MINKNIKKILISFVFFFALCLGLSNVQGLNKIDYNFDYINDDECIEFVEKYGINIPEKILKTNNEYYITKK